ncbi:MAG: DUF504 domain-containing protein [Thermoplasmatota archaeon]
MTNPKEILNELKWRKNRSLDFAEIFYVHRGTQGDYKVLKGNEITELGRSFIRCEEGAIPYHRVFQIVYEGDVIFSRDRK